MRTVTATTRLIAPTAVVWEAIKSPRAFVYAAHGVLRFPAAERLDRAWQVGDEVRGWTFLVGIVPLSRHRLRIATIDDGRHTMTTDEAGGIVRSWRHELTVSPLDDDQCEYVDRIDIDAGWLTPLVAGFAVVLFRHRQRRWRTLAPLLATAAAASTVHPVNRSTQPNG